MYHGQGLQDKIIHERYFRDKKSGVSIEAGAFDGLMESSTLFFEESLGWSCINVEASPPIAELLFLNRPNSTNLNLGLSNRKFTSEFTHYNHPEHGVRFGNGSIKHVPWHLKDLESSGCVPVKYMIECERYDVIIDSTMKSKMGSRNVDLFVLDVEGHELEVIEGMSNSSYLPSVMCVEYPMVTLERLKSVLSSLGYRLDSVEQNNAYFTR